MSQGPTIRRATAADSAVLAQLGEVTFVETFGTLYPPEDLAAFLSKTFTSDALRKLIEEPTVGIWLALAPDDTPIGFVVVGKCKLPVENVEPTAGEVRQLYVLARFQKLKLGTRLLDTSLDWLAGQGRAPLYVGVWSENYRAQRLYERYGFSKVGEYGFPVGKTIDREFILKRGA
jgi:ribosomal protein S18 acetylase RimI-like enzyme